MIAGCLFGLRLQMVLHLAVKHPLRQPLLQFITSPPDSVPDDNLFWLKGGKQLTDLSLSFQNTLNG